MQHYQRGNSYALLQIETRFGMVDSASRATRIDFGDYFPIRRLECGRVMSTSPCLAPQNAEPSATLKPHIYKLQQAAYLSFSLEVKATSGRKLEPGPYPPAVTRFIERRRGANANVMCHQHPIPSERRDPIPKQ